MFAGQLGSEHLQNCTSCVACFWSAVIRTGDRVMGRQGSDPTDELLQLKLLKKVLLVLIDCPRCPLSTAESGNKNLDHAAIEEGGLV